jgi:O-antigen ligase
MSAGASSGRREVQQTWARALAWGAGLSALAWLIVALPLPWAGAAALAVAGGILLLLRPWMVWVAIGAALPFAASVKWGLVSGLDLALALAFCLWFIDGVRRDHLRLAWSAPAALALVYAAALATSTLVSRDLGQAAAEVVKWLEFAAVVLILPMMVSKVHVRWVTAGVVAGATAQALLGIYQFVFAVGPEWFIVLGRFMRASGSFGQPNPFGGYLGLVLPVSASMALAGVGTLLRGDRSRAAWLWAIFYAAASTVIALGLLASWSRGAWLGSALALLVMVATRSRTAALWSGMLALVVAALALAGSISPQGLPQPIAQRLAEVPAWFGAGNLLEQEVTDENFALIERLAHWEAAQRMFERSPWIGVGAGNYAAVYPEVRLPEWEEALGHAHNVVLNVLGETGILGLAAFALLWVVTTVWVVRRLLASGRQGRRWEVALQAGVLGVLVHLALHNLVDNLFVQGLTVLVAVWLGLIAVAGDW